MILDTLKNASNYYSLGKTMREALEYLQNTDLESLAPGRYDITPDWYVFVNPYETNPIEDCAFEAHRKYIDIQLLLSGEEHVGYTEIETLQTSVEYNAEKDFEILKGNGGDTFTLKPGYFVVFYPQDAHMPGIAIGSPQPVRKIVAKVKV
ncbi:MAG: YhcH/YjgK/YiaL family protein [Armatimonadota bacterium]